MTEEKKQIIDTTHDYMSLIYSHVIKKEYDNNIYEIVKEDYAKIKKETENMDMWESDYVDDMDIETKKTILTKYGIENLLVNLEKIAEAYCFRSFKDFMEDNEDDGDIALQLIVQYIITEEIIGE